VRCAWAIVILAACNEPKTSFECTGNDACRDGASVGVCEETGFCSFDDQACGEGRRYGTAAGEGLGGACVELGAPPIGSWKRSMSLPTPRHSLGVGTDGTTIYAVAGIEGSNPFSDVWIADFDAFGITGWHQGASLPETRRALGVAVADGFIYAIGGRTDSQTASNSVLAAPLSVDAWATSSPIPAGLRCHSVVQSGNHVYVLGGKSGNNDGVTDVLIGTMSSGSIDWRAGPPMLTPRICHSAAVANGYLYVTGGCVSGQNGCSDLRPDVDVAKIESDGSLGPFQPARPLPEPRWHHSSAGNARYLVVTGGHVETTKNTSDVLVTHINPDGSLGVWREATPLVSGSSVKPAILIGDQMYLVGTDTEVATLQQ